MSVVRFCYDAYPDGSITDCDLTPDCLQKDKGGKWEECTSGRKSPHHMPFPLPPWNVVKVGENDFDLRSSPNGEPLKIVSSDLPTPDERAQQQRGHLIRLLSRIYVILQEIKEVLEGRA